MNILNTLFDFLNGNKLTTYTKVLLIVLIGLYVYETHIKTDHMKDTINMCLKYAQSKITLE